MAQATARRDDRPLRVLTLAPLPASVTGGIEEYAYGVVAGLRERGCELRVATSQIDTPPGQAAAGGDVALRTVRLLERPIPWSPTVLLRLLREVRRADLVHLHMPYPMVEALGALLARIVGRPLVVTYQMDAILLPEPGAARPTRAARAIGRIYRSLSARWPLRAASVVVTSTRAYVGESVLLPEFAEKVRIIYQGVSRERFREATPDRIARSRRERLGSRYAKLVTFVGRLVPYKGVDYLLEAIPQVRTPGVLFVIGGSGPQDPHLRALAARLGLTNVRFEGFVPSEELFGLFAASDLVVSPSVSELENTPISLLGARAVGTPVIGTSIGGTGETVPNDGHLGRIIPPRDSAGLARAIEEVLGRPRPPAATGRPRFWEDVADDYLDLFHEVLRENGPVPASRRSSGASAPERV